MIRFIKDIPLMIFLGFILVIVLPLGIVALTILKFVSPRRYEEFEKIFADDPLVYEYDSW